MKANMESVWRKHFIIYDNMHEISCTCLTPEMVLKTSGHVERFTDLMVRNEKNAEEVFRADKLIEEECRSRLADPSYKDHSREELGGVHGLTPQCDSETHGDNDEKEDNHAFERSRTVSGVNSEDTDRDNSDNQSALPERDSPQEVKSDSPADHFRDIGCHRDDLALEPIGDSSPARLDSGPQNFGQTLPCHNSETGREILDQPRDHVPREHDPNEQETELRPRSDVRGDVSGVEVGDTRDKRRSQKRDQRDTVRRAGQPTNVPVRNG